MSARRFAALLAAIAVVGLGARVLYVLAVTQHDHDLYDATYYELQAEMIVNGHGYSDPFLFQVDPAWLQPAADHPPLTVISLLPAATLKSSYASNLAMRFTMVLLGTATIVVVGVLGRLLGGTSTGLVAAAIAAVDPSLWMNDGLIMSEALATLLTALLVVGCYLLFERTTWPRVVGLGALSALAVLTRAEAAVYVPVLVIPAIWISTAPTRRLLHIGVAVATAAALLAPWIAFNYSRFDEFTPISTNGGLAIKSANCDNAYYGDRFGFIDVFPPCAERNPGVDQSVWDRKLRSDAFSYMRSNLSRLPIVVLARLGRSWNLFRVQQTADLSSHEGRPVWAEWMGAIVTWITAPLAIAGAFVLRRRRRRIWPLVVTIVVASTFLALLAGGLVRYRSTAEPAMIVLTSAAVVAVATRGRAAPTT